MSPSNFITAKEEKVPDENFMHVTTYITGTKMR